MSFGGWHETYAQREAVKDGGRAILIGGVEHAAKALRFTHAFVGVMRSSAAGLGP